MAEAKKKATTSRTPKTTTARKTRATTRVAKNTKAANTKVANQLNDAADEAGERFDNLAENAQDRAQGIAGGAVNLTKNIIEFQRENIEVLIESGKLTAEGALLLIRNNLAFTRENIVALSRALQGMASRGTPKQRVARQADYLLGGVNRFLDQAAANVGTVIKISGNAFEPISHRLSDIKEEVSKAA
tara:strand:+ start:154 stop:717 length:564 start_codon:yes stop_codon:yes gene_type:complete